MLLQKVNYGSLLLGSAVRAVNGGEEPPKTPWLWGIEYWAHSFSVLVVSSVCGPSLQGGGALQIRGGWFKYTHGKSVALQYFAVHLRCQHIDCQYAG